MSDDWLDEQVRDAFGRLELPADRVRRMCESADDVSGRTSFRGLRVALAAAATAAVVGGPLLFADAGDPSRPGASPVQTEPPAPRIVAVTPVTSEVSDSAAPDPVRLWVGSGEDGSSVKISISFQGPDGRLSALVSLKDEIGSLPELRMVTGQRDGDDVVLEASDLRVVLTVAGSRMTGRLERPGRPDLAIAVVPGQYPGMPSLPAPEPDPGLPVLTIRTDHPMLLYIDDQLVGHAPNSVAVTPGTHRIMVKHELQSRKQGQVREVEVSSDMVLEFPRDPRPEGGAR